MVSISIKRVVSVFILRPANKRQSTYEVALFRRCETMPTFPLHYAGISGSIEEDDNSPLDAAVRELQEETNIHEIFRKYCGGDKDSMMGLRNCIKQGLHVDVAKDKGKGAFGGRIIRVYPFSLTLPEVDSDWVSSIVWSGLEMKGTEHDQMKFMNIDEFLSMTEPCVPSLKLAFHHATSGSYLKLCKEIRTWEMDRVNGAAYLARQAVELAAAYTDTAADEHNVEDIDGLPSTASSIAMLRPSMVPIVNVMNEFDRCMQLEQNSDRVRDELLQSLDEEGKRCVDIGVEYILRYYKQCQSKSSASEKFVIGTFSRSSTMKLILERVLEQATIQVLCSQSTPGDEGELTATTDVHNAKWLPDQSFLEQIEQGNINLLLVGADCILQDGKGVVNKIGTAALGACCKRCNVPIICCADRWKLWEDDYPPPLEDIFELVPSEQLDHVLVPEPVNDESK